MTTTPAAAAPRAMTTLGFDSADHITGPVLDKFIAGGGRWVWLYIKWATPALCRLIHAKGLAIGLIWETTATRALGGYAAGQIDAREFLSMMPAHLGVDTLPPTVAPAWTVDFDATPEQQPAVLDYGRGWKDGVAGRLRATVYANGAICQAAEAAGIVDFSWVAGGKGMRGTVAFLQSPAWDIAQDVGDQRHLGLPIAIDSDAAADPALPWAWWPEAAAVPATPTSAPPGPAIPAIPDARTLQTALAAEGLYRDAVDGIWGPHSQAALAAHFQRTS